MTKQQEFPFRNQLHHDRHWWTRINVNALHRNRSSNRQALTPLEPTNFVLIACSKSKLPERAPARDLYTGPLFQKARLWAERRNLQWFIVSALHGLLKPDQLVDPYNYTIKDFRGQREIEQWARRVVNCELTRYVAKRSHAFLIMPLLYRRYIESELFQNLVTYENPVEHMGIGQQMQWLANN